MKWHENFKKRVDSTKTINTTIIPYNAYVGRIAVRSVGKGFSVSFVFRRNINTLNCNIIENVKSCHNRDGGYQSFRSDLGIAVEISF